MITQKLISQITQEQDRTKVYKLELSCQNITKISNLKPYERLRCLILDFNSIQTIDNLNALHDLRELHLENNEISKIENLQQNKALTVLNLCNNRIEKIEGISHLIKLDTLILDRNQMTKLTGLQYLKELKHISVRHNMLTSIDSLPAFSKLQSFQASHNQIKKIPNNIFSSSSKLTKLDLSSNLISDLDFLTQTPALQFLNLQNNRLRRVNLTVIMKYLQSLNISKNEVEELPYLCNSFPELISLNLAENMICSEIELINCLAQAKSLTEIDFRGNPMYTESFEEVLQNMHHFDFMNGKPMNKAGSKYLQELHQINHQMIDNINFYGEDDEEDRKIKLSGFYNEEVELEMTGIKPNRPASPKRNNKNKGGNTDVEKVYTEFQENEKRLKELREQYLMIGEKNNIATLSPSNQIKPFQSVQNKQAFSATSQQLSSHNRQEESPTKVQLQSGMLTQLNKLQSNQMQLERQNQKNLNKWKQMKKKQKTFNIRDIVRRSSNKKDYSIPRSSQSSFNAIPVPDLKGRNDLMKTQMTPLPRRANDPLMKGMKRPSSTRGKKQQ